MSCACHHMLHDQNDMSLSLKLLKKEKVAAASSYAYQHKGKRWAPKQRATAQHGDNGQGEKQKMAGCFTLLRRITRLKVWIQRSSQRIKVST